MIECGSFKGASTANLSIIANIVRRKLFVCDSFEGLPDDDNSLHVAPHIAIKGRYHEGDWKGTLEEVKNNIKKLGEIEACEFVKGFYADTLKTISKNKYVFAFIDVDLISSTKECLLHIWPRLRENGKIFSDDAVDLDIVKLFFNEKWWDENLNDNPPGFIGSGCGLPLFINGSSLGYLQKLKNTDHFIVPRHLHK